DGENKDGSKKDGENKDGGNQDGGTTQSSGNSDDNNEYTGSKSDIDFSTFQGDVNPGTVSPQ
ncbi:hypothetical protein PC110_g22915, partial [Phytophthora cactorum]